MFRHLMLILFYFNVAFSVKCQQGQFVLSKLTTDNGLASNRVYSIVQDRKGFIWFGTANGIQRYDGNKVVGPELSKMTDSILPAAPVSQMIIDKKERLWLRYGNEVGIFEAASHRFRKTSVDSKNRSDLSSELFCDSRGNIFLLQKGVRMLFYDSGAHAFLDKGETYKLPYGLRPFCISEDRYTGNYWIGTDSGLVLVDYKSKKIYCKKNNPQKLRLFGDKRLERNIREIYIDRDNRFWILAWRDADQYLLCYDSAGDRFLFESKIGYPGEKEYIEYTKIVDYSMNSVWVIGFRALMYFDPKLKKFHNLYSSGKNEPARNYSQVYDLYEDREHNIWLATDNGVYVFNPSNEPATDVSFPVSGFDDKNEITCFSEVSPDEFWIGSWDKGVLTVNKDFEERGNPFQKNMLNDDPFYKMVWVIYYQKKTDLVWIGCRAGRLMVYNRKTGKRNYMKPPVFEQRTIRTIEEDDWGNLWFGTQGGHLVKWQPGKPLLEDGFIPVRRFDNIVYKIASDKKGFIWVSVHEQGVYQIDAKKNRFAFRYTKNLGLNRSLYSDVVADILPLNDSLILFASEAISVLNTRTQNIELFTYYDGLPSNTVRILEAEKDGNVWISTLNGIARFNYYQRKFISYGRNDRLIRGEEPAYVISTLSDGRIVFGGNSYIYILFPKKLIQKNNPANVRVTGFKLLNRYLNADSVLRLDKIRLPYNRNSVTFEFASLNFMNRNKLVYYYKLEGLEKDWKKADKVLMANYTLMPPGEYVFKVWCENMEGIPSANITQLKIHINAPFWRTWWFLSLLTVVVLGGLYLIHHQRSNRLLAVEKIRSKVARDLHDDMGSTLSNINILSAMAKSKMSVDPIATSEYMGRISEQSQQMMEAMDDIVWSINPMNDSIKKIIARMREFATSVLEAKEMDAVFRVEGAVDQITLNMEARRDVFLIFKEAINNIAKYSKGTKVEILFEIHQKRLVLSIIDNGVGFNVGDADMGNGLINMRKRAQALHGRITIDSVRGKGTQVILDIPVVL